jgi:hypothetical protein
MRDRAGADPALAARRLFLFCFVCLFVIGIRRPGSICFALFLWGLLIRVRERGRLNFSDGNSDLLPRARVISEVTFRNGARWIFAPVSAARTRSVAVAVAVAVRGGMRSRFACQTGWEGGDWGENCFLFKYAFPFVISRSGEKRTVVARKFCMPARATQACP